MTTLNQYKDAREPCREVFSKKARDYGTSWRVLRPISIVDQIYIKAWRIRSIQELGGKQEVEDSLEGEFMAIVNYGYIALIQSVLKETASWDLSYEEALKHYDNAAKEIEELMLRKNHDYGEAWRKMSEKSFVDLILTKLRRIRQILNNEGKTLISEGIIANVCDIVNYALFALIKRQEMDNH